MKKRKQAEKLLRKIERIEQEWEGRAYLPVKDDWYHQLMREVHRFVDGFNSAIISRQIPILNIPSELIGLGKELPVERLLIPLKLDLRDMIRHLDNGCGETCVCPIAEHIDDFEEYIQG